MKEKAAATGTQKLGFVYWGDVFYLSTKVNITIKAACVYVCSIGVVFWVMFY